MYDIIVVGGGPAGLTAALYARRNNKTVLILDKDTVGGQITYSPKVENIPGFVSVTGNEFAEKMMDQVLEQGAELDLCHVTGIRDGEVKTVVTDCGDFEARAVILATGAKHRLLGLPGEENFIGNGISFCAVCDGAFYEDKTVAIIGGGNSALVEALLLADHVKKLYVVQNLPFLTADEKLQKQLVERENVEVILGTTVASLEGEDTFTGIVMNREEDGVKTPLALDGMFIAIGLIPQNEAFADLIDLTPQGYADSDESCLTKTPGIFVAGDCRNKTVRQVTTAAADGAIAALAACKYLDS